MQTKKKGVEFNISTEVVAKKKCILSFNIKTFTTSIKR